jgi:hypothetical protein
MTYNIGSCGWRLGRALAFMYAKTGDPVLANRKLQGFNNRHEGSKIIGVMSQGVVLGEVVKIGIV